MSRIHNFPFYTILNIKAMILYRMSRIHNFPFYTILNIKAMILLGNIDLITQD
ncbi:hypothetical protein HpHA181_12140 [Helicobacter pylori]